MTNKSDRVNSVETAVQLVEAVQELEYSTVTEIADYLDRPNSTIHNHLATLEEQDFVVRRQNRTYEVGLRFLEIGGRRRKKSSFYKSAKSHVDDLADETKELANLVIEEHGKTVHIYLSRGEKAVSLDSYIGMRTALHAGASGKAILANLDKDHVDKIIETHGLPTLSKNTITDRETLFDELEMIRDRGYANDREERLKGLRCVGAPVKTRDGELVGSISVSGPVSRFKGERFTEELPDKVVGVADMISLNLEYG